MNIKNLPIEIIELVLTYDGITIKDILNFSLSCTHFHDIVSNNNAIWKSIFSKRWPQFIHLFSPNSVTSWCSEVKYVFEIIKRCHDTLAEMPPKFYKRYELSNSDLVQWKEMIEEHQLATYYIAEVLMSIVNDKSIIHGINMVQINTPGNLTYRYYASKALRFVRQQHLMKEWERYMSLPPEEQILERGAVFIAQWCQPTIEVQLSDISKQFDDIASNVKDLLQQTNPIHPIFSTPQEIQESWRKCNLSRNQWSMNECKQIMDVMGIVLYKHLGFYGNNEMYYVPENSYINEVLEKRRGLPLTLAIVYESVARRLGVHCEPISFPAHFLLRWTYGPSEDDSYYIDVYNKGHVMMKGSCPHARNSNSPKRTTYAPSSAKQVMARMANNLELSGRQHVHPNGRITRLRSVLELLRLINPSDLTCMLNLAKLYMLYNMDVTELTTFLMNQEFDVSRRGQAHQIVQMLQDHEAHHKDIRTNIYPQVWVNFRKLIDSEPAFVIFKEKKNRSFLFKIKRFFCYTTK